MQRLKKDYSYNSTVPLGLRGLLYGELYFNFDTLCYVVLVIKRSPRQSMVRGSPAKVAGGKTRMRAPCFPSSAIVLLVRP
jgi:hypothetical protein